MSNKNEQCLIKFLNKQRYEQPKNKIRTHQAWGSVICGVFNIENNNIQEFLNLYKAILVNGKSKFSLLEIQKEFSLIIVDIDLNIDIESTLSEDDNIRFYDKELIKNVILSYIEVFDTDIKYNKNKNSICVFEKHTAIWKDDKYKDGFHIIVPDICLNTNERYFIREQVIKNIRKEWCIFLNYTEDVSNIVDKSVIASNGWFLYGSGKPNREPYTLMKVYDCDFNELDISGDYVNYFSLLRKPDRYSEITRNKCITNAINSEINETTITLSKKYN